MKSRHAFTLIELLVVVGIIVVLVSILLPAVNRAMESGRRVTCLNNLRQIALGLGVYASENGDFFPRPAVGGGRETDEDWVYWSGIRAQNPGPAGGRIVPYLGGVGSLSHVLICPSDLIANHHGIEGGIPYPYSYTVNEFVCRSQTLGSPPHALIRRLRISNPAEIILVICESMETIDDGCFAPQNYVSTSARPLNLLSNRHDRSVEKSNDPNAGRGTAAYCDGHAEFIERLDSTNPQSYVAYPGELN